jgi:alpha-tubulin suppressor-like RCC1 family protein
MKKLLPILFCFLPIIAFSQTWKTIPVSTGGQTGNVFIYRPADSVTNGKPGVVVFWHGAGQAGTDTTKLYEIGPLWFIKNAGWRPNFYIVAVQTPTSPASYSYVRIFMNWLFRGASAPVKGADTTRIGMTGLSYGGYNTYAYVDNIGMTNGNGIVPYSAVVMSYEHANDPVTEAYWTATHRMWGLSDPTDGHSAIPYFTHLISAYPGTNKRVTSYSCSPPHGCWNTYYDPAYNDPTYSGNVYDFMQVAPSVSNLTANAGNDQNVTLPTTVTLSGAASVPASGKTITAYQWTGISGPNIPSQSGPNSVSNTLSGLTAGTYVFQLMVTQSDAATATDSVTVVVNPDPSTNPVINVSPTTINGLTSTTGTAGTVDSFTVSGLNLVTNINVSGTTKCEVSLSRTTGFTGGATVTQSGGVAAATKVYVRIKASAPAGAVAEANNITSAPAPTKNVLFNGNVSSPGGGSVTVAQFNFALSSTAGGIAGWVDCLGTPLNAVCTASDSRSGSAIGVSTISTANWANVVSSTTSSNGWGATTANPTFYFPSGVYPGGFGTAGTAYTPGQEQLQFTGLNPANHYRFEIMGSRTTTQASRRCVYFIVDNAGTTSDTLDVKDNTANFALFTGKLPTTGGVIKMAFKRDGSDANNIWGAYVMAIRIIQEDQPPSNTPPVAAAGPDQVRGISLATASGQTGFPSQAFLDGSASNDPDGTIATYSWTKLSGPADDTLYFANTSKAIAARLKTAGVYVYQLAVTDNGGLTTTDTISVTATTSPVIRRPTPGLVVKDIACNEYSVAYLASNDTLYMRQWDGGSHVDAIYGFMGKPVSMFGGQYDCPVVDDKGYAYWVPNSTWPKIAQWIEKDKDGNVFNNLKYVAAYLHQWMFIKTDGSLWTWGVDNWRWYNNVTQTTPRSLPMPAGGVAFSQVGVSENAIICLATNGNVYQYNKNDSTPHLVTLPRPATGIAAGRNNFYCAIVPDAGQPATSGRPFCWGNLLYTGGTNTVTSTPVDMHGTWNIGQYIKQVTANDNTLHALDVLGRVWGFGNNDQGEVGNGYDRTIHCEIVGAPFFYNWDWAAPREVVTAPANITPSGITIKKMFAGTMFAFYNYFIDTRDTVWSYGRNKSNVLGDGYSMGSGESTYPNGLDEPAPTYKSVLYAPSTPQNFVPMTTSAGADQNITGSSTTLNGAATPSTFRTIVKSRWRKQLGGTFTMGDSTALSTTLTDLQQGAYAFILRITDDKGATREDTVGLQVTSDSTIGQQYKFSDSSVAHKPGGALRNNPFTVSPNPFTTGVDIIFPTVPREKTSIRLLDITGRTLLLRDNAFAAQDRIHFDLSGLSLSAGVYLLEVRTGSNTYIIKIQKARL